MVRIGLRAAALCLVLLEGCSSGSSTTGLLQTQEGFAPGVKPPCLVHQNGPPAAAYRDPGVATQQKLTFLAYFTATGAKPFCDGKPATAADRAWAELYVASTSEQNRPKVSTILG